jgi:hypothetical protein
VGELKEVVECILIGEVGREGSGVGRPAGLNVRWGVLVKSTGLEEKDEGGARE